MSEELEMNQPIEGLRSAAKIDGRTSEGRAQRAALRSDEMRPEGVRADARAASIREAELRAQEIIDALDGSGGAYGNELDLPADLAPPGWEYELKAVSVAGKDNTHHMLGVLRSGWRPVPASRHPWLMPAGHEGPIEIKGLQLMEKPKILTDRARAQEKHMALEQLRNSEAKLSDAPPNTGPRDHPKTPVLIQKDLMRPMGGDPRDAA